MKNNLELNQQLLRNRAEEIVNNHLNEGSDYFMPYATLSDDKRSVMFSEGSTGNSNEIDIRTHKEEAIQACIIALENGWN